MRLHRFAAPNGQRYVQLLEAYYDALVEAAKTAGVDLEEIGDIEGTRQFDASLAEGSEEFVPDSFVQHVVDGDNLVRAWRELRGMSLTDLASAAKLLDEELAEIETDQQSPTVEQLKAIARGLKVTMDDLVR